MAFVVAGGAGGFNARRTGEPCDLGRASWEAGSLMHEEEEMPIPGLLHHGHAAGQRWTLGGRGQEKSMWKGQGKQSQREAR